MIKNDSVEYSRFMESHSWDYMMPNYDVISMGSAQKTPQNTNAIKRLNKFGWPFFLVVDKKGIVGDVHCGFAVGDDVHAERPAKQPYANQTIRWMIAALQKAGRKRDY
jgi:hypothetical protein